MKSYIKFIIITFIALLQLNCRKDSITFINGSRISGTLSYLGPNGPMPVPAGATLNVFLEGNTFASYTLKTTQLGNYSFTPQAKGVYILKFVYSDTLLLYNAAIRQKVDLDSTRATSKSVTSYDNIDESTTIFVDSDNALYTYDYQLKTKASTLKLVITDVLGNPLKDARVCIYSNKTFADQNSPYCAGSIGYLSSDANGIVIFSSLDARSYYINARAEVGMIKLNNFWSAEMRETSVLSPANITQKTIVLQ